MKLEMSPIKPNLWVIIAALCFIAWLGKGLYHMVAQVLEGFNENATQTETLKSVVQLLTLLVGFHFFMPIITALGGMGVKLLSEGEENKEPQMPVSAHEKTLEVISHNNSLNEVKDTLAKAKEQLEK